MRNKNKKFYKQGVSLVTVLLFMLVATIAATATFKWITSENRSSSSRMLKNEAYQSARAGIENARGWMTFHANEVGSIIKQYFDGKNEPILLNSALKSLEREGQKYNIWLTGVDASANTYKLKLLSVGESRKGSKHSEVAILNVDGLYRVKVPSTESSSAVEFDYSYYGGSINTAGEVRLQSAIINGNWAGNPIGVEKNFVVTGNASLSGNNINIGGTSCIGGDFYANNGFTGTSTYIVGNANSFTTQHSGDIYFGGDVNMGSQANPGFNILGNVTLAGKMSTNQNAFRPKIAGNLCVTETGQVYSNGTNNDFVVEGNVWMPGRKGIWTNDDSGNNYTKIKLGSQANSEVYIADAYSYNEYNDLREEKKFQERNNHPKKCKQGRQYVHDNTLPICDETSVENFDNNYHYVYRTVSGKTNGYCLYYMPPGVTDVDFGTYLDSYWKWCYPDAWGNCSAPKMEGTQMNSYFINASVNDATTRYRDSYSDDSYRLLNYNGSITGSPYCKTSGDAFRPECGVKPWFQSMGTVYSTKRHNFPSERPFDCAEQVKEACDSIWVKEDCPAMGTHYKVKDPLVTAKTAFEPYASMTGSCASTIKTWTTNSGMVNKLNACYEDLSTNDPDKLYNGYLVVKVSGGTSSHGLSGYTLRGKFIIIATDRINPQNGLPNVEDNSYVMLYLEKGAGYINQTAKNYFIYSEDQIGEASNFKLNGTLYFSTDVTCTKGASISKIQGNATLTYNEPLIKSLADAGVICDSKTTSCGGASGFSTGGGTTTGSSSISLGGTDAYYISTSPQLTVTLETQYETNERMPDGSAENIDPSIIVLPRIVYLTQDPVGKLEDYYNVINLNGATEEKDPSQVTCNPSLNTTTALYDDITPLTEGIYTCRYQSGDYGTIPFFVVVSGLRGQTPAVSFTKDADEILAGGATKVTMRVPISTRSQPMTVDIIVTHIPTGWTVTPTANVTKRTDFDGGSIYTATLSPAVSTVDVFNVTTESTAEQGSVYFGLTAPFEGCIIGSPDMERVVMTGYAHVSRKPVSEYCAKAENTDECNDLIEKLSWKDCEDILGVDDEWVKANGLNVITNAVNYQWDAVTTSSISLIQGADVPSYCEVIIPSGNNTITDPQNDQSYDLYASIKRRPYTLDVVLDGANDNDTKVIVTIDSEEHECTANEGSCSFRIYAGNNVELAYTVGSSDEFSVWKCSGSTCPVPIINSTVYTLGAVYNNHTVTAVFNDNDEHCFYDDFTGLGSFCSDGETDCIADCLSEPCPAASATAEWQMIFGNSKGKAANIPPVVDMASIYTTNTKNANNQNGTQTLVLNSALAGSNGTLNTMFQTTILAAHKKNEFLNSGFLIRSASEMSDYLMINVYGVGSKSTGDLTARMCRAYIQGINNSTGCTEVHFENASGNYASITPTTMIKLEIKVDKDTIALEARVSGDTYKTRFDAPSGMNDLNHQYVGFALSDAAFRVYDIGWVSGDYNEECYENPQIFCSFTSNYLGAIVPKDSVVYPWIGASSWFTDNSCTVEYGYNGTDNSMYKPSSSKDYNFSEEGLHGFASATDPSGFEKNAYIEIDCPDELHSSLDGKKTNCGDFWVGKVTRCSQNIELSSENILGSADVEREISFSGVNNLREATLIMQVSNLTDGFVIKVRLKDENDHFSLPATIDANGTISLDVNVMSDVAGFDPQRVTGMTLNGTSSYNITSIQTSCDYAMGISNCIANYNGASWQISSVMKNVNSSKCYVEVSPAGDFAGLSEVDCPLSGNFNVPDADLYNRVNAGSSSLEYSFNIRVTSDDGTEVSCNTNVVRTDPLGINCEVSKNEVIKGMGTPSFISKFENCPPAGCNYSMNLQSETETGVHTSGAASETWTAPLNTAVNPLTAGTYTYRIESMGKSCEANFNVVEPTPASAENCRIEGSTFKAHINASNDGSTWSAAVATIDPLGNPLNIGSASLNADKDLSMSLSTITPLENDANYIITLVLNGAEACSQSYMVSGTGSLSSSSATSSSSAGGSCILYSDIVLTGPGNNIASDPSACFKFSDGKCYQCYPHNGPYDAQQCNNIEWFWPRIKAGDIADWRGTWAREVPCVGESPFSANCSWADGKTTFWPNEQNVKLNVSSISGLPSDDNFTLRCETKSTSSTCRPGGSCDNLQFTVPETFGTHHCTLTNSSGLSLCNVPDITINRPLTCNVSKSTVGLGESFTFNGQTATYLCHNCWLTDGGHTYIDNQSNISYSVSFSSTGNKTLSYRCQCDNMPADAAICSQNVTVEEVAPTISCPANKDATVNSSVTVAPTNLTGCSSGCSYTIEGSSATGNGYTGGNVSFNGEASTGSRNYTFRVSNSKGSASCNFSINYVNTPASSSSGGGYDCRESWGSKPSNVSTACRINGGNCYKCNPERGGDCGNGWLWTGGFNPSWVSYWFVEIPCSGGGGGETPSSSSETPASSSAGGGGGATHSITLIKSDGTSDYVQVRDEECISIGVGGNFRCEHGWQSSSCSINISANGIVNVVSDGYCNMSPGTPINVTAGSLVCLKMNGVGGNEVKCRITTW